VLVCLQVSGLDFIEFYLTHPDSFPGDCSDSPENLKRSVRTIDILFSSAFLEKFGDLIELDSLVGFGHSYGSYLMTVRARTSRNRLSSTY
jgi:hypothetical protein